MAKDGFGGTILEDGRDEFGGTILPDPVRAAPPKTGRSWLKAAADTGVQLAEGTNNILGAIPSLVAPDSDTAEFFKSGADYWRNKQSNEILARLEKAGQVIDRAGQEGVWSQVKAAASEYASDPALAARLGVTNIPSLIPGLGLGKLAQFGGAAAGLGVVGQAALGTGVAGVTNSALNAGGARGDAYDDIKKTLIQKGVSPADAEELALQGSVMPAAVGAATGYLGGKIGLEKALLGQVTAGGALKKSATSFAAEMTGEQIEEVLPKLTTNAMVQAVDPTRRLTQDIGRTAVETAFGAGPTSVAAAGATGFRAYQDGQPPIVNPSASAGSAENEKNTAVSPVNVTQPATNSVANVPTASAAEKALLTPVALTSLDRVNELDTELSPVRQRLAELTPENGYGPMFDQERLDLTAQVATLDQERSGLSKDWPAAVPGLASSFTTEAGARVEAQYALIDAGDLITSHDESLRKNPLYPPELQPRERDRAASEMQVSSIVQKLDPARLGLSADAANGAPIVGADGLVESGNARTIALKRVYQAGGQKAEDYKAFLRDNASQFGITPESVNAMAKPVLVRVRSTPVNRAEFARQANASTVAAMAPSEQAKSDSSRMDSLEDLTPDDNGDFSNAASRPFVRRFMARLPITEQTGMVDANGDLSTTGYARVRNAVLAKAYGDSPVLARMTESMDDNLRNVSRALMMAAPKVAQMREAVSAGNRFDADITPDLMGAVEELSQIKDAGGSVQDALAQADLMGDQRSPEASQLLRFLADNLRRPRRMADFINAYMDALDAAGNPSQGSLLGAVQAPSKRELLTATEKATQNEIQDSGSKGAGPAQKDGSPAQRQSEDAQSRGGRAETNGGGDGPQAAANDGGQPGQRRVVAGERDAAVAAGDAVAWLANGKRVSGEVVRAPDARGSVTVRATGAEAGAGIKTGGVFNVPLAKLEVLPKAVTASQAAPEVGSFGPILTWFKHDAQGAIKALTELQDGDAVAALHHPEVGDIDLVWGKAPSSNQEGYGLAKISAKHPEVLKDLQGFLNGLHKDDGQSGKNRIRLVDDKGTAVVRLQWEGNTKTWLLTAFEDVPKTGTRTDTASFSPKDDTASLGPENGSSLPKDAKAVKPVAGADQVALFDQLASKAATNEKPLWERDGPIASTAVDGSTPYPKDQNGAESVAPPAPEGNPSAIAPDEAANLTRGTIAKAGGASQGGTSTIGKTDDVNPDIRMSRGEGGGMDVAVLEALAARIQRSMPNMPKVNVLASPLDAPPALRDYIEQQGAMNDVDGAMHKGELYLFASGLPDALRAEHVLAEHEAAHFGLRAILGDSLQGIMQSIYNNNAAVRQAAAVLQSRGKLTNTQATEEVIVDIPSSQLVKLNGWRKVVQRARDWLAAHGFEAMAAKLSGWLDGTLTDQQRADLLVANLVSGARAYMSGKRGKRVAVRADTMLSGTEEAGDAALSRGALNGAENADPATAKTEKSASPGLAKPVESPVLGDARVAALKSAPASPDPKDASPLQKAKAKALSLTSPQALDQLMYDYTDKYIDLKRIRDHIKSIGGTITDLNDAYLGEELYHKRLSKRVEDFLSDEVQPLLADLRARGVGAETFEEFLHARHAPEANKAMAARNPTQAEIDAGKASAEAVVKALEAQLQGSVTRGAATTAIEKALALAREEGYKWVGAQAFKGTEEERLSLSGMSDAQAQAVMAGLTPDKLKDMNVLAARVDAINAKTMDTLGQYGLMDQESLGEWRKAYQFYIPLHRDEAHPDSISHPIGQGFSVKGDASKRRTGSNAKVTNILGHISMQREAALTRGEKNTVVKKLYVMAAQNPVADLWTVEGVPKITQIDKKTGFAHSYPDPMYKNKPNVVMVRIAGKDAAVVFNERNPQGVRLAGAMKNIDVGDLGAILTQTARVTRYFAAINTQYNPVFGLINFARDIQAAMLNLSTTALAGQQAKVAKGVPTALRAVYRVERGKAPASAEGAKWAALWKDLQEVGGTTGYRDMYSDAQDRMNALLKDLQKLDRGQVSQAAHAVVDWLSDYNDAIENGVRLSAYSAALDQGMSRERAGSLAKNLTVNFNRKGAKAREIGALYAFFNAAIQGNARMFETLRGPIGKKIMFGGVALGMITTMLGMAVMGGGEGEGEDDEWEGIPEFVKERAIVIPLGRKDYMAIPLPLGFHVFPNFGRLLAEWAMGGPDKSLGKQVGKVLGSLVDSFNPVGGGSDIGQVVMPTVMDPLLALWRNKDWTGRPIYREDGNSMDPTPGFTRAKDAASTPGKLFAEGINKISGGNEYRPGAWSPTPDQFDYVVGQLTGGLGRELLKVNQVITTPFTGDELPAHKIPVLGRVYGNTRGSGAQSGTFYENVRTLNEVENEVKGRNKNDDDADAYMASEPLTNLIGEGNSQDKIVSNLRKQRKQELRDEDPGYKDRVKEINTQIEEEMRVLNRAVSRVKSGVAGE